ncbi:MAG: DUF4136 domain-containing protein [Gammaproteobacteria bacterium]|nr:DUF4136 domain-containing protein [Gammaproteobacteria bacterium]
MISYFTGRKSLCRVTTLSMLMSFAVGCATISTGAHYDETNNFGEYRTFSWIDDTPYISAGNDTGQPISPLTVSKIQNEILSGLEAKGYHFIDERNGADFVVAFTVGTRQEISIDSYPAPYYGTWGWHVRGSHYYVREVSAHNYTRGTLGVDVFDGKTKQPVWHGWAEKTVTASDRQDPEPSIKASVANLLEAFPK